jgi:hypothetical protein
LCLQARAQRELDHNTHVWVTHIGDHRLSERWGFHTEGHLRRANTGADPQQLLLRPAINYHLHPDVLLSVGYSYYYNYRYGQYPIRAENWEHNVYQQVQLTQRFGKLALSYRFRLEQRFLAQLNAVADDPEDHVFDRYNYQSRFRLRVMATWPLGKHQKVEAKTWFLSAYDEFFFNFGDDRRIDHMQQNRLSGLLGYQWNKHGNVQLGYLQQIIQRPGAALGRDLHEMNRTLHLILTYNLDFRKPKVAATP